MTDLFQILGQADRQDISMKNHNKKCQVLRSINCLLIVYSHQESDKIEGFNKTLEAPWKDFMAVKRQNEKYS